MEQFNANNITVLLEWVGENGIQYYLDASVAPEADMRSIGRSSTQLILSYNTPYTVNMTASLCGSTTIWTVIDLIYGDLTYILHV